MQEISLFRLFLIFLKIGATAFGGNVALVAAVRKDLCEKRKILSDAQVLDFTTLGNVLPGPLATNVITSCGYAISGMAGAIAGLTAILLPAFILMCVLSEFYFRYGESPMLMEIFGGLLPGVAAIIAATAWSLAKKNISNVLQVFVLIGAGAAIFFLKGFLITLLIVIVSGLIGFLFFNKKSGSEIPVVHPPRVKSHIPITNVSALLLVGILVYIFHPFSL